MRLRAETTALAAAALLLGAAGCVRRTISITTEPAGAIVWLNDREIGRTPVDVEFAFYGVYDVRLERQGYEPLLTSGDARAPWWETAGLDLVAELAPAALHSRVHWHYVLRPADDDPADLLERARELRGEAAPGGAGGTDAGP